MNDSYRQVDWQKQRYYEDVTVSQQVPAVSIPLDLQRLVMESGANRDIFPIHHDRDYARASGAPDPYANTSFILGMFERTLREWIGLGGFVKKIGPFRMVNFMTAGHTVTFRGKVKDKWLSDGKGVVVLEIIADCPAEVFVRGEATVILPTRLSQSSVQP